jgi:DNA-binding CsgD family transcriptional regulator
MPTALEDRTVDSAMRPREFTTGDPLFTVDRTLRVLTWNSAAERLTGVSAAQALGRPCWDVLGGVGERGDVVCHAGCSNARLAHEGFPLPARRLRVRTSEGHAAVDMSTLALSDGRLLHLLRPPRRRRRSKIDLTPREAEVLKLMADGLGAKRIMSRLAIAETTARTHIRAILRELGAHSQLEAVAKARRAGLL